MALLPRTVMSRCRIEWESQPGIRQCQGKPGWGQSKETRLQVTPNTNFIETPVEFPGVGQTATISGHQITQTQSVITYSPQYHKDTTSSHTSNHHFEEGMETPED